ncbi:MAG: DUF748 domain-containing protein [Burkholderiales bacterium]|nr:DUF748 domain-containing protein [Bacteroidia bacterium]
MKHLISKIKKPLLIISGIVFLAVSLIIIFISPIAKYLVEKYDVKYIGREVKMDWAYVNPFTGYVYLDDLIIYEQKSDSVFLEMNGVAAHFSMTKLFSKTYEIESLSLDEPVGKIIQIKKQFNFSDIIELFSPKKNKKPKKGPVHFNLLNAEIKDGTFYFSDPLTPINYSIIHVNLKSDGKLWDSDTINGKLSLQSGIGKGDLDANFMINIKTLDYRFGVDIRKFDMLVLKQYLKDLSEYGNISTILDANVKGKGNFKNKQSIDAKGRIALSDFHFGKDSLEDYASYDKLTLVINELAPAKRKYFFDTVNLENPYFKYEKYDHLDNIQRMFGKKGSKLKNAKANPEKFNLIIELSKYIQIIFKNFLKSDYKIKSLTVKSGNFIFNDYSVNEKFTIALNPLNIEADSVDNTQRRVKVTVKSGIKPYGSLGIVVSMNPKNKEDFDLTYRFHKIPAPLFNPYLLKFTSFPLDRGTIELTGNWNFSNNFLQSTNHFIAIDPRLGNKMKKENSRSIPMPLIMAFIRERGNVIDYKIPITGDLKNPRFHISDIVFDLLKNILIKPPTTLYGFEVRNTERDVEKFLTLKWELRQTKLDDDQDNLLSKIVRLLKENPQANITIHPQQYTEKEKEYILFFEAKKKYFLTHDGKKGNSISEDDSLIIEKMSIKDSTFVRYLNRAIKDSMIYTVQDKCYLLLGKSLIDKKYKNQMQERKLLVENYFKEGEVKKQVHFIEADNVVPRNSYSFYKINYKGEMPESLKEAFEKLYEIDNKPPRKKYFMFRKRAEK